jgi:hypothetical protein
LKVLNQTHQAISNPSGGKSKAARAKKDAEVFTISKDGMSVTLPLRTPRSRLNVDRDALEFLGFTFVGEGDEAELEVIRSWTTAAPPPSTARTSSPPCNSKPRSTATASPRSNPIHPRLALGEGALATGKSSRHKTP